MMWVLFFVLQTTPAHPTVTVVQEFGNHEACLYAGAAMKTATTMLSAPSRASFVCVHRMRMPTKDELVKQEGHW